MLERAVALRTHSRTHLGGDVTADRGRILDINKTNTSSENI